MCRQFRFDNKSQCRVFLAKPRKAADLKTNLSAPFTKMTEALAYVFDKGPEVGYHLKRTKGVYLLGRCERRAEALRRKLALIARFHFEAAMIHPDNGGDKLLYGAKVLGSYVGSEESIANRLEKKLAELKKEVDAVTTVGLLQIQYLLLLPKDHSPSADYPA